MELHGGGLNCCPMERLLLALLRRDRSPVWLRYVGASAIVLVAAGLRFALGATVESAPYLMFIPGVFVCALLFDRGSGLFATALSAIVAYQFVPPAYDGAWRQLPPIALFVLVGALISLGTEALRRVVRKLEIAERGNALLLQEIGHRAKNDLTIITSALKLQARGAKNPAVRDALDSAIARVGVVVSLQQSLCGFKEGAAVEIASYVRKLCGGLGDLLRDVRPIVIRVEATPLTLSGQHAVSIGLIVNELVTNSFKHAFPGDRAGTIDVEVAGVDSAVRVVVRDDGVGCPADAASGLGSRLVELLALQHGGTVTREATDPGCRVTALVPVNVMQVSRPSSA